MDRKRVVMLVNKPFFEAPKDLSREDFLQRAKDHVNLGTQSGVACFGNARHFQTV
jgi:hypothetical protein